MILKITKNTDSIWKQKFKNVSQVDSETRKIVADMKETLEFTGGVGLAAPQVDIPFNIFIANFGKLNEVFINPKIVSQSKETGEGEEGCLSVPGFRGLLNRSSELVINYIDLKGRKKTASLSGFYARIIQHEYDHLKSTFYIDKIVDKKEKVVHFKPTKLVFFGTPKFGATILKSIIGQQVVGEYKVLLVVTQPDQPFGRGQEVKKSAVKQLAEQFGIRVIEPTKLDQKEVVKTLQKLNPDVFVVASYGQILPKDVLNIPKYGSLNLHASLLPKYRGASPIQGAILNKEKYTGVTIMLMNERLDEGEILAEAKVKISPKDTFISLHDKLAKVGSELLHQVIYLWINKRIKPRRQTASKSKATYTPRLTRDSGFIDALRPPKNLETMIRAYHPWPGVWTRLAAPDGAASGGQAKNQGKVLKLLPNRMVQLEGKSPVSLKDFKQGHKDFDLSW
ncbi:MAG: methionyl-tRNA formyltransferase [Candidatus Woykebacteria bacterium]